MDVDSEIRFLEALSRARESGDVNTEIRIMEEMVNTQNRDKAFDEPGTMESLAINFGHGLIKAEEGAEQLVRSVAGGYYLPEGSEVAPAAAAAERQAEFESRPVAQGVPATIAQVAGEAAPYMAAPVAAGVRPAALTGGVLGAAQFTGPEESRVLNTALGAFGGAAGAKAGDWFENMGQALYEKISGKLRGEFDPETRELVSLGEKHDVPVYGADVSDSPGIERLSTWMDKLPLIGTMGPRLAQRAKQRQAAVEAMNVFDEPADVGEAIQEGLRNNFKSLKATKDSLYGWVAQRAGDEVVPTTLMQSAAKEIIVEERKRATGYIDEDLISSVQKYVGSPKESYAGLSLLRSEIGDKIKNIKRGTVVASERQKEALQSIKQALEMDMEAFAKSKPKLQAQWEKANSFYKNKYAPVKFSKGLQAAIETEEPDRIIEKYVKASSAFGSFRNRAKTLYNALDNEGRDAVRYAIVARAWEKASGEGEKFNPSTFARIITNQAEQIDVFMTPMQKREINGLAKLLKRTAWHGDVNPPTGARLQDAILGGGATYGVLTEPVATGAALSGAMISRVLLTSKAGRKILARAGQPGRTDRHMDLFARQALRLVNRAATAGSAQAATDVQEQ